MCAVRSWLRQLTVAGAARPETSSWLRQIAKRSEMLRNSNLLSSPQGKGRDGISAPAPALLRSSLPGSPVGDDVLAIVDDFGQLEPVVSQRVAESEDLVEVVS